MSSTTKKCLAIFFILFLNSYGQDYRWEWQNPKPQGNKLYQFQFTTPANGFLRTSGRTLLVTTNAGVTWTEKVITNTTDYFGQANNLFFVDSLHGYAVGSGTPPFITKTRNGGKNWEKVPLPKELGANNYDNIFGIFFIDTLKGFISDDLGYIFRTTDGGDSWFMVKKRNFSKIFNICFPDSVKGYAIGDSCLYVSSDGGKSWMADFSLPINFSDYKLIYFKDSRFGWITIEDKIFRTTDGGLNWDMSKIDTITYIDKLIPKQIHFMDRQNGWLATNRGLYRSTDGGTSWKMIYTVKDGNIYTVSFNGIYFSDNLNGFATGHIKDNDLYSKFLYRTTDGGQNWTTEDRQVTKEPLFGVDFINKNNGWAAGNGLILNTSDGGKNWVVQNNPESQLMAIKFLNQNNGWTAGSSGMVMRTTDGGKNWIKIPINTSPVSSSAQTYFKTFSFINENEGWVAGEEEMYFGKVFHTSDAGQNWEDQTPKNIGPIQGIFFIDKNTGWLSVGDMSYNYGEIYKTTDGGRSWGLKYYENSPCFQMFFVDSLIGWVVGKNKVLRTTDGGKSWNEKSTNRSFIWSIGFLDKLHGWMGGSWGDIWYTKDGGDNWALYNSKALDNILGIDFVDLNTGWAVGNTGGILHTENFTLSVEKPGPVIPLDFKLFQNYPNPFNSVTIISYIISEKTFVRLKVFDILGREITTLVESIQNEGEHKVYFEASSLPSGVYIYSIQAGGFSESRKLLLLK